MPGFLQCLDIFAKPNRRHAHYSPEYVKLSMTDGCGYVYFPQQYNLSPITKGGFSKIKKMYIARFRNEKSWHRGCWDISFLKYAAKTFSSENDARDARVCTKNASNIQLIIFQCCTGKTENKQGTKSLHFPFGNNDRRKVALSHRSGQS